jgi:BCD family chlorophyll transporter-like MFS transporter
MTIRVIALVIHTLRLALPKAGVGWMFALLTIDFNRVAIVELGVTAVVVTTMLSMHYFLSPFQVIIGRFSDQHLIAGYKRTPYMILGGLVASLLFCTLPSIAQDMATGMTSAYVIGFAAFLVFGIAMAMIGDSYHSLISEVTTERTRSTVIAVVWIFAILSTVIASVVMNAVRPEFTPEAMQRLYNLTPFIVMGSILLGVIGMEKRLTGSEANNYQERAKAVAPSGNPLVVAARVLQENSETRGFFCFIFVAIFAIFLQDNLLEVFGAEVLGLSIAETTRFQPTWGGGVLAGMLIMGVASVFISISRQKMAIAGCLGMALSMAVLALSAYTGVAEVVVPTLFVMGIFTGAFNVGALSMMMDMTVEGATGLYMGLWGVAQAFGTGISSIASGAFHTTFIESGLLSAQPAYMMFFMFESICLLGAAFVLSRVSVARFRASHGIGVSHSDMARSMEANAVA